MSDVIVGSVGVQLVPSAEGFVPKTKALLSGLTAEVGLSLRESDVAAAEARLDEIARTRTADIKVNEKGIKSAERGMSGLVAAALVLAPALSPLTAVFAGITATAGVAVKAVLDVEKTQKKIDQLRVTAATSTSKKTAAAATAQADFLEKSLNRTQKSFLGAQAGLSKAFNGLLNVVGPALFQPLTLGLKLITAILPKLAPLIYAVSRSFSDLIKSATANVEGGGLTSFIQYTIAVMPQVLATIGALVRAIANIGVALAPLGGILLDSIKVLADIIAGIPPELLGAIATGILAIAVATKAWALAQLLLDAVNPVTAILGIGAALVYAYETSESFRAVAVTAFVAVARVIQTTVVPAIQSILDIFFTVINGVLGGLSSAFGWLPFGIGNSLTAAADKVRNFSESANASLQAIRDKTITINVRTRKPNLLDGLLGTNDALPPIPTVKTPTFSAPTYHAPKVGGGGGVKKAAANAARTEARKLLSELASGIRTGGQPLITALNGVLSHLADFPKKVREHLRSLAKAALTEATKIQSLKSSFTDLAKTIKDAFTPGDLFSGTLGGLTGGLAKALANVKLAIDAQKKLVAAGIAPVFASALLSSGNGLLAAQVAANPGFATQLASQYGQLGTLTSQLGASTAGAQFNPQLAAANAALAAIEKDLSHLATDIGHEINRNVPKRR